MKYPEKFDVIIIGGGHAGAEAAYASANMGAKTLLLTQQLETIGQMSCNPAIGGLGKSQLVAEVDALGGLMGIAADRSGIQYRTLNATKGAAVRASRAQADKNSYRSVVREMLERCAGLYMFQQEVQDLLIKNDVITGVVTKSGVSFLACSVVLTAGTFLAGRIHIGDKSFASGRAGDAASNALAEKFRQRGFEVGRLKTGTPARLDGRTINYDNLDVQHGDEPRPGFSFLPNIENKLPQLPCHITYTNKKTLDVIKKNIAKSAIFSGEITGLGPRYCPSIEDKAERFAERERHQIFIEPEGIAVAEVYPNGISTSLPFDVQYEFIRTIEGFENAHITRPGYAIEYDFFDPRGLFPWLETKKCHNLFFAGQINGTTGYEEAAAQGFVAGVNAARRAKQLEPWVLRRDQAYIGVMIDDLVNNGTIEPYRMFTSRSEYRLSLRQDNADARLTAIGKSLGTITDDRWQSFSKKTESMVSLELFVKKRIVLPEELSRGSLAKKLASSTNRQALPLWDLLKRPEIVVADIADLLPLGVDYDVAASIEVNAKYEGYIARQSDEIVRQKRLENKKIPRDFNYALVSGLSTEVTLVLQRIQPATVAQASRVPGVTPAAISILLVYLKATESA